MDFTANKLPSVAKEIEWLNAYKKILTIQQ